MKRFNYYLTAALIALALLSSGYIYLTQHNPAGKELTVEIYQDGQLYRQLPLAQNTHEELRVTNANGNYNIVEILDGRVRVKEADCPNQVCVNTGWLHKPGQIAFCAPNKVKVVVTGETKGLDATSF
ncbi:MAG: NusG domain II-containing protein [Pelotomaculum sp.]|jgi:hypothetical protein